MQLEKDFKMQLKEARLPKYIDDLYTAIYEGDIVKFEELRLQTPDWQLSHNSSMGNILHIVSQTEDNGAMARHLINLLKNKMSLKFAKQVRKGDGLTPIGVCAGSGDIGGFNALREISPNWKQSNSNNANILHYAVLNKDNGVMTRHILSLLSAEEILHMANQRKISDDFLPIMTAAAFGDIDSFNALIESTYDWRSSTAKKENILHAVAQNKDDGSMMRHILSSLSSEQKARMIQEHRKVDDYTPLYVCAAFGNIHGFELLAELVPSWKEKGRIVKIVISLARDKNPMLLNALRKKYQSLVDENPYSIDVDTELQKKVSKKAQTSSSSTNSKMTLDLAVTNCSKVNAVTNKNSREFSADLIVILENDQEFFKLAKKEYKDIFLLALTNRAARKELFAVASSSLDNFLLSLRAIKHHPKENELITELITSSFKFTYSDLLINLNKDELMMILKASILIRDERLFSSLMDLVNPLQIS